MLKSAKRFSASIIALACVSGFSANAQIVASGSLTDLDPWGIGWKNAQTGGLKSNMWKSTSAETVNELLGSIDAHQLTPVQANLLKAVILSGGKAPSGDISDATSERLRLLRELGENAHATNLLQRFPSETWSEDPHKYEADLDLATGDNIRACSAVELAPSEDPFWQTLRATCFALAGNAAAASLAAEMAVSTGEEDPWFFDAVGAIAEQNAGNEKAELPPANYSSGAAMALSLAAKFPSGPDAAVKIPAEYAALLSERTDAPEEIRIQALLHAARAGLIDANTVRSKIVSPKPKPAEIDPNIPADQQVSTSSDALRSPLERAVDSVTNPELSMHDRAVKLIAALVPSRGNPQDYALNAKILLPELRSIPQIRETAQLSPSFVEAALAAGDFQLAQRWRDAMDNPFDDPPPAPEPITVEVDTAPSGLDQQGPASLIPSSAQAPSTNGAPTLDEQLQALNDQPEIQPDGTQTAIGETTAIQTIAPPPRLPPILHSDWDKARFDMLLLLASPKPSNSASKSVAGSLIAMNESYPIESVQYLSILSGLGLELPPEARTLIGQYQNSVPSMELLLDNYKLDAALRADAMGEAVLRAFLILRDNQPHSGSLIPYTNSLNTLKRAGLQSDAMKIAFEAIAPWGMPNS